MQPNNPSNNSLALISFILGILGFGIEILSFLARSFSVPILFPITILLGFFLAFLAIILGLIALVQMRKISQRPNNRWMGIVGMTTGILTVLLNIFLIILLIIAFKSFS